MTEMVIIRRTGVTLQLYIAYTHKYCNESGNFCGVNCAAIIRCSYIIILSEISTERPLTTGQPIHILI